MAGLLQHRRISAEYRFRFYKVGGVERGERNISLINIQKIAFALEVSPADLLMFQSEAEE